MSEKYEHKLENNQLSSGIFWIITENINLSELKIIFFPVKCDFNGNPIDIQNIELNSKNKKTYNHKLTWNDHVKNNNEHKPYNKKEYNYYPRGRVEISNNHAVIFLNPHINDQKIIDKLITLFGLFNDNISKIDVKSDGSEHYKCFIDLL